jgi:DNA-binding SARP family transcriptional activator
MSGPGLQIHLLGDPRVILEGRVLALPPSKKTRALLAYLVATGRPHLRERLCDLLWEGPDDPRGALRWSLTKLRPLLGADDTARLVPDRERVAFSPNGAEVDVTRLAAITAGGVSDHLLRVRPPISARRYTYPTAWHQPHQPTGSPPDASSASLR